MMNGRNAIIESDNDGDQDLSSSVFEEEEDIYDDQKSELHKHLQKSSQQPVLYTKMLTEVEEKNHAHYDRKNLINDFNQTRLLIEPQ